jgi:hypothetical protein
METVSILCVDSLSTIFLPFAFPLITTFLKDLHTSLVLRFSLSLYPYQFHPPLTFTLKMEAGSSVETLTTIILFVLVRHSSELNYRIM